MLSDGEWPSVRVELLESNLASECTESVSFQSCPLAGLSEGVRVERLERVTAGRARSGSQAVYLPGQLSPALTRSRAVHAALG